MVGPGGAGVGFGRDVPGAGSHGLDGQAFYPGEHGVGALSTESQAARKSWPYGRRTWELRERQSQGRWRPGGSHDRRLGRQAEVLEDPDDGLAFGDEGEQSASTLAGRAGECVDEVGAA